MAAISTLCDIISQGGKVSKDVYRNRDGFDLLCDLRFVIQSGVVQSIVCDECDQPHDAQIVFENRHYGYHCPDIGFVALPDTNHAAIIPDIKALVASVADCFRCNRRKSKPVHGSTWRVGSIPTNSGDLAIYFRPTMKNEKDAHDLEAALLGEIKSPFRLILTTDGTLPIPGVKSVRLDDVVHLDSESGEIREISDPCMIVGAPTTPEHGRPNQFRAPLKQIYLDRKKQKRDRKGRNEEANAILIEFNKVFPHDRAPSRSLVRRYLTDFRRGS